MNKFLVYCKSDGLGNATRFFLKTVFSKVYNKSHTLFYSFEGNPKYTESGLYEIREINEEECDKMSFARLKLLATHKWFKAGARCFVAQDGELPFAFAWLQKHEYHIHAAGSFVLDENEYWLGPAFVDKAYRGKGTQKDLIVHRLLSVPVSQSKYYTSSNINNIPSKKSLERIGFKQMGEVIVVTLFGITISKRVLGNQLLEHLR